MAAHFNKVRARITIDEVVASTSKANVLEAQRENVTFSVARLLNEIATERYAEELLGVTFREWVESTLVGPDGEPHPVDWARALAGRYRVIARYPDLEEVLAKGKAAGVPGVTFTSAYYTARLADYDEWTARVRANSHHEFGEITCPEDYAKREQQFRQRLKVKLVKSAERSSHAVRAELAQAKTAKGEGGDPAATWPYIGGKVMPEVKASFEEITDRIIQTGALPGNTATISFIGRIERVTEFCESIIQAFDAVEEGDSSMLNDVITKYLGAKHHDPEVTPP